MKYTILVSILIVLPLLAHTQNKLSKLQAPSSPAMSIMELQPSAVLAPKSYQALETALFSNFVNSNSGSIVPNDFALEFTPYWTKNHRLSVAQYLYPKSGVDQFVRNSSFSIASTQNFLLGDSTASNGLSFGYRTTFYFGNKKDREVVEKFTSQISQDDVIASNIGMVVEELFVNDKVDNQEQLMLALKEIVLRTVNEAGKFSTKQEAEEFADLIVTDASLIPALNITTPDPFLDSLYNLIDSRLCANLTFNKFKNYIGERYGFSLDVAYAGLINFPTNKFESSYVAKQSFWITPTYRLKDKWSFLKIMAVVRYEWYNQGYYKDYFPDIKIYENNLDYGFAMAGEFSKFSLSFELVGRSSNSDIPAGTDDQGYELFRKEHKSDYQYIGSFSYNLTDEIVLSYSIGNRFEPVLNPDNTLVSLLALNIGFGSPKKNDIDWTK